MKKVIFIFATVFLAAGFSFAQEASKNQDKSDKDVQKISVEDAVILTADNNISLKKQRINLDLLEKTDRYSWNSISPTIGLSAGYSDSFVSGAWNDGKYTSIDTGNGGWNIGASLSLRFTPALFASMKTAELNYQNGIISYEEYLRSLEMTVRKNFYSLIFRKENIALQERNMETARLRYENNKDKYSRGQLSELELLTSQYQYESLKPKIEGDINTFQNELALFKQTLGLEQSAEIELIGSMDDVIPPENLTLDVKIEAIPSIKKTAASIEAKKINLASSRFTVWGPSLSATYSYALRGKAESGASSSGADSLSVNLSIPLDGYLPWSTGALGIENQKAGLEQLRLQYEDEKTSMALSIENKIKSLNQMKSQIESQDKSVELAQRAYDMTLRAYNAGSRDLYTLQSASDSLMSARITRQQQLYSIFVAVLDLENTLGLPFGSLGDKNQDLK